MDFELLLVFISVLVISALFFRRKRRNRKLPSARITIPYIGTLSVLSKISGNRAHEVFLEEAKQLGSVFGFSIGNKYMVVLNGFEAIHEALVKNSVACAGRMEELRLLMNLKDKEVGKLFL